MKINRKNFKKGISFAVVFASVVCSSPQSVFALPTKENVKVHVNRQKIKFDDEVGFPIKENDRIYLPLRVVSEALDIDVTYNELTKAVEIRMTDISLDLFNNDYLAVRNGVKIPIDERDGVVVKSTTVKEIKGRTYVPVRFISEQLNVNITYEDGELFLTKQTLDPDELALNREVPAKDVFYINEKDPLFGQATIITMKKYLDESKNGDLRLLKLKKIDENNVPISIGQELNLIRIEREDDKIILELDKDIEAISVLHIRQGQINILSNIYINSHIKETEGKNRYNVYLDDYDDKRKADSYIGIVLNNDYLKESDVKSNSTVYLLPVEPKLQ